MKVYKKRGGVIIFRRFFSMAKVFLFSHFLLISTPTVANCPIAARALLRPFSAETLLWSTVDKKFAELGLQFSGYYGEPLWVISPKVENEAYLRWLLHVTSVLASVKDRPGFSNIIEISTAFPLEKTQVGVFDGVVSFMIPANVANFSDESLRSEIIKGLSEAEAHRVAGRNKDFALKTPIQIQSIAYGKDQSTK